MTGIQTSYRQSVIDYYDKAEVSYRDIWDLDRSMALHYGYWDKQVRNFPQSLLRMNEILAGYLSPAPGNYILDAGCGVGGSSFFLAGNYHCITKGISLSEKQVASARRNAIRFGLDSQCTFMVADYTVTGFPDHSFDAIWAMESVCHAPDKSLFLKEAFRILKPGGKLVLSDGFKKQGLSSSENNLLQQWLSGWSIQDLETIENMKSQAIHTGFRTVNEWNLTKHIMPTSKRMYRFGLMAHWFGKLKGLFGLSYGTSHTIGNTRGAIYQYYSIKKGFWDYYVFYAEKP